MTSKVTSSYCIQIIVSQEVMGEDGNCKVKKYIHLKYLDNWIKAVKGQSSSLLGDQVHCQ